MHAGLSTAQAELEFNVGAFSDYLLWGTSASSNNAVVQGGIDWGHESGFYLGTWASTLADEAGQELDLYTGYAFAAGGIDIDLGYIYYYYPALDDFNYGDIVATVGYGPVYGTVQYALNADDSDYEGSTVFKFGGGVEVMPSIALDGELGYTEQKSADEDVTWTFWSLGLTKSTDLGDISLTYAQTDDSDLDPLFVAGYSISF
ncbi:MAG: TorF family putative porin [Xanthomonadaceae bacterium]|nr:TorF family putative porin [Xanthomonadaceae bacterium]